MIVILILALFASQATAADFAYEFDREVGLEIVEAIETSLGVDLMANDKDDEVDGYVSIYNRKDGTTRVEIHLYEVATPKSKGVIAKKAHSFRKDKKAKEKLLEAINGAKNEKGN